MKIVNGWWRLSRKTYLLVHHSEGERRKNRSTMSTMMTVSEAPLLNLEVCSYIATMAAQNIVCSFYRTRIIYRHFSFSGNPRTDCLVSSPAHFRPPFCNGPKRWSGDYGQLSWAWKGSLRNTEYGITELRNTE